MNRKQFDLLCFYCWQLNIKTLEQLAKWQAQHNAHTNAKTLDAMAKAYNGTEWATLHGLDQNINTAEQTATTKQKKIKVKGI